jgi:hypothetical protein
MKAQMKGKKFEVKTKANASITISCRNSKGNLIRKRASVSTHRVIRQVADQFFVITPVIDGNSIVGYAVEGEDKLRDIHSLRLAQIANRNGSRIARRRLPRPLQEVYDLNVLPDGMFICSACQNFVKSGHRCPNATR